MVRVVLESVIGVIQRFLEKSPDVGVVGGVEDPAALPAAADEAGKMKLREVLRHRRRAATHYGGELIDRPFSAHERPEKANPGRLGEQRERLDGPIHLIV